MGWHGKGGDGGEGAAAARGGADRGSARLRRQRADRGLPACRAAGGLSRGATYASSVAGVPRPLRRERFHRPDLVLLDDPPIAIEVELTAKFPRRLQDILRGWRWTLGRKQFGQVRYLCSPRAFGAVGRAADRISLDEGLKIERLEERRGRWVIAGRRSPFAQA